MGQHLFIAAAVVALTLLGFFLFPGHTYLQSDTQIYLPILEHYWNRAVFTHEILALHPHVSFTIYDEAALLLRRVTGLEFRDVLALQQLLFRGLGILGVFLIATSLQLRTRMALLVAGVFSLGATILGPAVLTFEYEPVPRGFAIPLLVLAVGLVAHGRDLAAGVAASLAFLYHAPSVWVFWLIYFALTLWPTKPAVMGQRIMGLLPLLCAVVLLLFLSRLQTGVSEAQPLFGRIDPELERLQRLRAPYNWVSTWDRYWYLHYSFLWLACVAAFLRLRRWVNQDLEFFLLGMPLLGLLSVPASYLLLERVKWVVAPQLQPARAVLFVTAIAGIMASVAAVKAVEARRWWESALWFALAFGIPVHTRFFELVWPNLADPMIARRRLLVVSLAAGATALVWLEAKKKRWHAAVWAAFLVIPFFLVPNCARVSNYPALHTPELAQLSRWARSSTPLDAVFLFPDAGRQMYPGIFRADSLRAVYVDWKAGGQVNFLRKLGDEWWVRWKNTMLEEFRPSSLDRYRRYGIDYVVLQAAHTPPGWVPVFQNGAYVVLSLAWAPSAR